MTNMTKLTNVTNRRWNDADLPTSGPWWRHPIMWLVIGGPAIVVLASIGTLALAITHPDPVVHASGGVDRSGVAAEETDDATMAPALKARNHAATGGGARR